MFFQRTMIITYCILRTEPKKGQRGHLPLVQKVLISTYIYVDCQILYPPLRMKTKQNSLKKKKGPNTKRKVTVLTWHPNIIPRFLPYFNFTLLNHQFYPTCSLSQFTHHIFILTFSWHFNFKA